MVCQMLLAYSLHTYECWQTYSISIFCNIGMNFKQSVWAKIASVTGLWTFNTIWHMEISNYLPRKQRTHHKLGAPQPS